MAEVLHIEGGGGREGVKDTKSEISEMSGGYTQQRFMQKGVRSVKIEEGNSGGIYPS